MNKPEAKLRSVGVVFATDYTDLRRTICDNLRNLWQAKQQQIDQKKTSGLSPEVFNRLKERKLLCFYTKTASCIHTGIFY